MFFFFYGDNDPQWRVEGPKLYHFRSNSIEDVETKCNENWKIILENRNELPTTVLRNFDENGDFISYLIKNSVHVSNDEPTHVSNDEPTHVSNDEPTHASNDEPTHVSNDEQFSLMSPSGPSNYNNISISEFSPILNTCITTPQNTEDVCLPLSSTPSSSQTCVTPSQPVRRQLVPELEENCEIIDDYATSDVLNQVYVSKHVQLIAKVIGDSAELATFDSLHVQLKSRKGRVEKCKYQEYKDLVTALQVKVLKEKSTVTEAISRFEKDYYSTHQQLPPTDNLTYSVMCKNLKYIKALLRSWKIAL